MASNSWGTSKHHDCHGSLDMALFFLFIVFFDYMIWYFLLCITILLPLWRDVHHELACTAVLVDIHQTWKLIVVWQFAEFLLYPALWIMIRWLKVEASRIPSTLDCAFCHQLILSDMVARWLCSGLPNSNLINFGFLSRTCDSECFKWLILFACSYCCWD